MRIVAGHVDQEEAQIKVVQPEVPQARGEKLPVSAEKSIPPTVPGQQ